MTDESRTRLKLVPSTERPPAALLALREEGAGIGMASFEETLQEVFEDLALRRLSLAEVGTSGTELMELRTKYHRTMAEQFLRAARQEGTNVFTSNEAAERALSAIAAVSTHMLLGSLSFEEVGTSQQELQGLIRSCG